MSGRIAEFHMENPIYHIRQYFVHTDRPDLVELLCTVKGTVVHCLGDSYLVTVSPQYDMDTVWLETFDMLRKAASTPDWEGALSEVGS